MEEPVDPNETNNHRKVVSFPTVELVGHSGLEPEANGLRAGETALAGGSSPSQPSETVQVGTPGRVHRSHPFAANPENLVTRVLQESVFGKDPSSGATSSGGPGFEGEVRASVVLTVKEVAAILRVSTFTVYGMIERGELGHVRVSNTIRVVVARIGSHCYE